MQTNLLTALIAAILCITLAISAPSSRAADPAPAPEPTRAVEPAPVQSSLTLPLWPTGKMPGRGAKNPEHDQPAKADGVQRITDVSEPNLALFKAPHADKPTPAVIICPGGGYSILAYNKEGTEIAAWLNSVGVSAVVLKYRVPGNPDGAFDDIQRAVRLVRQNAAAWNIAPNRVGIIGFSAGGHLCARLSTHFTQSTYPKIDAADEQSIRPDFAILVYPAYLATKDGKLAADLPITDKTPPTFMVHTEDDKSFVPGSKAYHAALEAAHIPNEFFLVPTGGHGYGLRSGKDVKPWPKKCQDWLTKAGMLP